jgi:uncharacterized protein (DUF2126 family)
MKKSVFTFILLMAATAAYSQNSSAPTEQTQKSKQPVVIEGIAINGDEGFTPIVLSSDSQDLAVQVILDRSFKDQLQETQDRENIERSHNEIRL